MILINMCFQITKDSLTLCKTFTECVPVCVCMWLCLWLSPSVRPSIGAGWLTLLWPRCPSRTSCWHSWWTRCALGLWQWRWWGPTVRVLSWGRGVWTGGQCSVCWVWPGSWGVLLFQFGPLKETAFYIFCTVNSLHGEIRNSPYSHSHQVNTHAHIQTQ